MGKVKLTGLRPGQREIIRSFQRHGADSLYVPSDPMDLRVCSAMRENGLLAWWEGDGLSGYELTPLGRETAFPAGRAALESSDER